MPINYSALPWNFEAFRKFINYETLQNAASVICLFENKYILESPKELQKFESMLNKRTGLDWSPERLASADILFNTEGSLFRNKARVLTSFYLIDPLHLKDENKVVATPFCKALGAGFINKENFYSEIIKRFTYPHPAYDENWQAWKAQSISLKPLLLILDTLTCLAESDIDQAYLNTSEFSEYGHSNPNQGQSRLIANSIIENRSSGNMILRERSDKIERKISDMFGFLCMSQYCYYEKDRIRLNLLAKHKDENVNFILKRGGQDVLQQTRQYINTSLERS